MNRSNLLNWLAECTGDDVWSIDYCKRSGIPDSWIRDLSEIYESGFKTSKEVLYHEGKRIHQYRGIRDSDLARRISQQLGYRWRQSNDPLCRLAIWFDESKRPSKRADCEKKQTVKQSREWHRLFDRCLHV